MPDLSSIRHSYATSTPGDYVQNGAEFDAALAQHDREVRDDLARRIIVGLRGEDQQQAFGMISVRLAEEIITEELEDSEAPTSTDARRELEAESPSWEKEETDERVREEGGRSAGGPAGGTRTGSPAGSSARTAEVRDVLGPVAGEGRAASTAALPAPDDAGGDRG